MNLPALMFAALHGWLPMIRHEARAARVDTLTLAAIVWHESRGDPGAFFQERDGACSVGLGGVRVAGCREPAASELHDPEFNLRASARILAANERWCRQHRRDRQCRAGERVFRGGGAVNHYGGNGTAYAHEVLKLRRALARALFSRAGAPSRLSRPATRGTAPRPARPRRRPQRRSGPSAAPRS